MHIVQAMMASMSSDAVAEMWRNMAQIITYFIVNFPYNVAA